MGAPEVKPLLSDEHFSVDGTLLQRRLSGKKTARGADLSTSQSLLRMDGHGLRVREMTGIEI
jgi:hypothetical protein